MTSVNGTDQITVSPDLDRTVEIGEEGAMVKGPSAPAFICSTVVTSVQTKMFLSATNLLL